MDVLRRPFVRPIDMVRVNVGGKDFITRRATLCAIEGSILEKMFRPGPGPNPNITLPPEIIPQIIRHNHCQVQEVFIDRSPVGFELILEYLRNGFKLRPFCADDPQDMILVELLRTEANFYGLTGLKERCDAFLQKYGWQVALSNI